MPNRDLTYLNHILDCIVDVEQFVDGYNEETFIGDKKTFNSSIRMFEIIGEAANKIDKEFASKYPEVEWRKMAATRNIIIHNYTGIDYELMWEIVTKDIPELEFQIKNILKENNQKQH